MKIKYQVYDLATQRSVEHELLIYQKDYKQVLKYELVQSKNVRGHHLKKSL